jgi:hypothetical protein
MNGITASCMIAGHVVYQDGQAVFENKGADLPGFLLSAYQHFGLNYPRFYKMDNLSKLGWLASESMLHNADRNGNGARTHPPPKTRSPEKTGLLLTNANASLDTDLKYFETVKDIPSPSLFGYTLPNIVIGEICIRNNFKGENTFFVCPVFDAGFMERSVGDLLDRDVLERCICGWVDLLGEDYKAVLFLVEKMDDGAGKKMDDGSRTGLNSRVHPFTRENMERIFQDENFMVKIDTQ